MMVPPDRQITCQPMLENAEALAHQGEYLGAIEALREDLQKYPDDRNIIRQLDRLEEKSRRDTGGLRRAFLESCQSIDKGSVLKAQLSAIPGRLEIFLRSPDLPLLLRQLPRAQSKGLVLVLQILSLSAEGREALLQYCCENEDEIPSQLLGDSNILVRCIISAPESSLTRTKVLGKLSSSIAESIAEGSNRHIVAASLLLNSELKIPFVSHLCTVNILQQLLCTAASLQPSKKVKYSPAQASSIILQICSIQASFPTLPGVIETVVTQLLASGVPTKMGDACSIVALLITIDLAPGTAIFSSEGFLEEVMAESSDDDLVKTAALSMLSQTCLNTDCRQLISSQCMALLQETLQDPNNKEHFLLATLILCKLGEVNSGIDVGIRKALIAQLITSMSSRNLRASALEALMFMSTYVELKDTIASHLIKPLLNVTDEFLHAYAFTTLTILTNLAKRPPALSEEEEQLRRLSLQSKEAETGKSGILDTAEAINARITIMAKAGVPELVSRLLSNKSQQTQRLIVHFLKSIADMVSLRSRLAQSGVITFLVNFSLSRTRTGTETETETVDDTSDKQAAAHALAKFLVSLDPNLVFNTSRLSSLSAIAILLDVVQSAESESLAQFEALLALTNLGSMGEDECVRINKSWDVIIDFIFSPKVELCRAAIELICNLVNTDVCARNFLGPQVKSTSNRRLVIALLESDDYATQRAACGAVASLSSYPDFLRAASLQEVQTINTLLQSDQVEIVHRAAVMTMNYLQDEILRNHFQAVGTRQNVMDVKNGCESAGIISLCDEIAERLLTQSSGTKT